MNFKAFYDAVNAQNTVVQEISATIEDHCVADELDQALALEPKLDEAIAKADQLTGLYNKLAAKGSENVAANLVPTAEVVEDEEVNKTMPRTEFDALDPQAQMSFVKGDGVVTEEKE